ncbi:hypothetical protein JTE90_001928 [Oedothorax gibbosus]|uniref:Replication protein A subunit n=1 Tax=Oedothorax gibbosus TaxID=931172 RepID=A0AAV6VWF4_9ARAC|nr:hypothetical protein JTE90_001928 [Oedothorax gibbosus]
MASSTNFSELSAGSIKKMMDDDNVDPSILQIMGYKKVPGEGTPRYRLLLNDGETLYPLAILAIHLNYLIEEKQLEKFTIFKLNKYACTEVRPGTKILICLEIESLSPGSIVGNQISVNRSNVTNGFSQITPSINNMSNAEYSQIQRNANSNGRISYNNLPAVGQPAMNRVAENSSPSKCISTQTTLTVNNHHENSLVISSGPSNVVQNNRNVSLKYNTQTINQSVSVVPIISLTPYQNKWTLKARVIYKTSIVTYSNQRGEGKFFSFYLLDETAEIKAIAFNNQADLHDYLEIDKVYYITGANVKPSKENSLIKSDFELMVTDNTKIERANDGQNLPYLKFNFVPIPQIKTLTKDNYVDVIGVCCSVSNLRTIVSKVNNREVDKIDLLLIDMGEVPITLSLWGSDAKEFKRQNNPVIVVRNARVTDFNGISLSVSQASMFFVNPSITEVFQLRTWFDNLGDSFSVRPFPSNEWNSQSFKTFHDINCLEVEATDQPEYFMMKADVVMVNKEKAMYRSCPQEGCFKKVTETENNKFKCEKCNMEYDSSTWTLLLTLNLADFSDSHWTVAFRDTAEMMIGYPGEQLNRIREENEDKYLNVLSALHFQSFVFKLRSKVEVFNDTSRLKTTVLEANPVEPVAYTKKLVADIRRMERILNAE